MSHQAFLVVIENNLPVIPGGHKVPLGARDGFIVVNLAFAQPAFIEGASEKPKAAVALVHDSSCGCGFGSVCPPTCPLFVKCASLISV